jgi:hypothetical protein
VLKPQEEIPKMGMEAKTTRAFAQGNRELAAAWLEAIDEVLKAASDTAEFHTGEPIGRSRTASIRRLKTSIDNLEKMERMIG